MTKNAKTVWIFAIAALIVVLVGVLVVLSRERTSRTVLCGDGPRKTIDLRDFETHYSGYSVQFQASIQDKVKFAGQISPVQLQKLSESLQSANEFRKFVVAGYNSCAITKAQYSAYGSTFQSLDGLAKQIDALASSNMGADKDAKLGALIQAYIELSHKLH